MKNTILALFITLVFITMEMFSSSEHIGLDAIILYYVILLSLKDYANEES